MNDVAKDAKNEKAGTRRRARLAQQFQRLRRSLQLTPTEITHRTGGLLSQSEWSKIEHGRSAVTTTEKRRLIAKGLGLPLEIVHAVANLEISADEALERAKKITSPDHHAGESVANDPPDENLTIAGNLHVPFADPLREGERLAKLTELAHLKNQRFPNLELCLMYHRANGPTRWRPSSILAAQHGHFGDDDRLPAEWERALDRLEGVALPAHDVGVSSMASTRSKSSS